MEQSEFSGVVYRYNVIRSLPKMHKRDDEYDDNSFQGRIVKNQWVLRLKTLMNELLSETCGHSDNPEILV
jgi:hypothetical protein